MKSFILILIAFCMTLTSCSGSDSDDAPVTVVEDNLKVPPALKGIWKVDYYSIQSDPSWIVNNEQGYFIKFSEDNLTSYKDWYLTNNNEQGKYYSLQLGYTIQLTQIQITTKSSASKPGYTEFHINYQFVPEKNSILFAKKI